MDCCRLGTAMSNGGDFESCVPSMLGTLLLYWRWCAAREKGKSAESDV